MKEYEILGHMTKTNEQIKQMSCQGTLCCMPYHAVVKEDRVTTKVRVVFNASSKNSSGISQLVKPTLQDDLLTITTRSRKYKYAITADVRKMYPQVSGSPEQAQLQKIVWRSDPPEPLAVYDLNTVTYDIALAPYLAVRCLRQTAHD